MTITTFAVTRSELARGHFGDDALLHPPPPLDEFEVGGSRKPSIGEKTAALLAPARVSSLSVARGPAVARR